MRLTTPVVQLMGCSLVTQGPAAKECLESNVTSAFVMGNSSPDAVKGLGLHSYEFAGALFLYALSLTEETARGYTRVPNEYPFEFPSAAVAFAAGFGSHMSEDTVGHHNDGYLTPAYDHPLELAVDTYEYKNFSGRYQFQDLADSDWAMQLIADASASQYANGTATVTFSQVEDEATDFKQTTDFEGLVIPFNVVYEDEMVRWDNYGATNWTEAESHYYHSKKWCLYTAITWIEVMSSTLNPMLAEEQAEAMADYLFANFLPFY